MRIRRLKSVVATFDSLHHNRSNFLRKCIQKPNHAMMITNAWFSILVNILLVTGCEKDTATADRKQQEYQYNNDIIALNNKAEEMFNDERYDKALMLIDKSLAINSGQAEIYNFRGVIKFYFKDDYESAMSDFTNAIDLNPRFIFPYTNRGWIHFLRNNYDMASRDFSKHLALYPNDGWAYFKLGILQYYAGDCEKALACFSAGIGADKSYEYNHVWLLLAEIKQGTAIPRKDLLAIIESKENMLRVDTVTTLKLFAGEINEDDYLNVILAGANPEHEHGDDTRQIRSLKSASFFYIAKYLLTINDIERAKEYFSLSINYGHRMMSFGKILSIKELDNMQSTSQIPGLE